MEMDLNQKIKNIEEKLEKLLLGNSSISDVMLFCDDYQELDYKVKGSVHREKIGNRVISILKLYLHKYHNDLSIHKLKNELALIMWGFPELREEAKKLREEALEAQPDLKSSPLFPPYWYEDKPFSNEPEEFVLTEFHKRNLFGIEDTDDTQPFDFENV